MILDTFFLVAGIALLVYGGELLVRGASGVARHLRVSPLITGLTIVAFGTSAPELSVNLLAAWRGNGELSFGNIMGSNMANIGLVLGCAALMRPIPIHRQVAFLEIPLMLMAAGLAIAFGLDRILDQPPDQYGRGEGLVLLFFFALFLYYTYLAARRERRDSIENADALVPVHTVVACCGLTLLGLLMLWLGGQLTIDGSVGLARAFGVSEAIIGITLVAVGTSLPELAASLAAVRGKQPDLIVGNVLGSNIFNILLVLGASAVLRPVPVPGRGFADLAVMGLLSVLMLLAATVHRRRISRIDGIGLLAIYGAYVSWRAGAAVAG
ncbi:MAG: calcium/sodium antiporter [Myxococcota bacterium]|nr:calcium/sodium antiporter [Myxococcota bacterium]